MNGQAKSHPDSEDKKKWEQASICWVERSKLTSQSASSHLRDHKCTFLWWRWVWLSALQRRGRRKQRLNVYAYLPSQTAECKAFKRCLFLSKNFSCWDVRAKNEKMCTFLPAVRVRWFISSYLNKSKSDGMCERKCVSVCVHLWHRERVWEIGYAVLDLFVQAHRRAGMHFSSATDWLL